jgi:hypothetical protein
MATVAISAAEPGSKHDNLSSAQSLAHTAQVGIWRDLGCVCGHVCHAIGMATVNRLTAATVRAHAMFSTDYQVHHTTHPAMHALPDHETPPA